MRNRMETKMSRRLLSLALSAAMVLSLLPVFAFAEGNEGLCEHHPAHTPECGYVAAVEGQDCAHVCGDDCFTLTTACTHVHEAACYSDGVLPNQGEDKTADACTHVCTEESGCVTKTPACVHTAHDEACGYVAAVEGQPCGYVCTQCAYTGWVTEDGNWYYLVDGVRQTGWQNSIPGWEGKWFYFDPATGVMQTDLQGSVPDYVGAWYYLDPATGAIQTGGVQNGGVQGRSQSQGTTFNGSSAEVDENGNLRINDTNFPDERFRGIVASYDTDGSGSLSTAEVAAVTQISCAWPGLEEVPMICNLKGIEYFTALTELVCEYNQLTSLDVSKNTALINLYCFGNQLTSLDVSKNTALINLHCFGNQLTSLDVSKNTKLINLDCSGNQLTSLDVSINTDLTYLVCGGNQLTVLDLSGNTKLTDLDCSNNQLTSLDVSINTDLTYLVCGGNQLTVLDLSGNTKLTVLGCSNNKLTSLDVSSLTALRQLWCQSNALTSLDLSSNSVLGYSQIGNQTATGEYIQQDGKYLFDLGKLVGSANLSRVSVTSGGTYNSATGIVTLDAPVNGKATFKYNYNTQKGSMDVTMTLTAHTHSFDSSGNCACGLVKQVPYVDAKGNSLGTQVCIPITKDTTTLSAGWYVAQGDVTIGTEEAPRRVTVNGDVHLILEDGCDLKVNGGIQVQDNSTDSTPNTNALTIYAQSTAESTMGKLTAQNVDEFYAAIGGYGGSGGKITINGGYVKASSGGGAGIGGGRGDGIGGSGGTITINGGYVKASSSGGAGIGGGSGGSGGGGDGGTITITGGIVEATSNRGAAIGGGSGGDGGSGGTITINGGYVKALSSSGAGIGGGVDNGGGDGGSGGTITITGGIVEATSNRGAAIGGGFGFSVGGSGGVITISGGIVTATRIGGGGDGGSGSFSTGTNGNAVIFASSIAHKGNQTSWSGVIFEGQTGKVYGSPTLSLGLPVPENQSLTLNMDGNSLTFAQGTGITQNSGSTLKLSGPGTFPDGISVSGDTLANLLAEGWVFTQNGTKLPVSGVTSLSGVIDLANFTITGQPEDISMICGEAKSLSVTAEPVTPGSTVTYQWYLDGSALTGETQSTLTLSGLNAGDHTIYCAVTCDGFTVNSSTAKVTVNKAAGSVTITGNPGKTYDGQSVSMEGKYTITGTGKVEYKRKDAADSTYTTTAPKDAGNYTVRVTAAEDANHTAASETKDFTITPKTVTLTVTVKDKPFDDTTTAEIDTVNTNGIVAGDDVQVASGTPSFTRKTPGENIPVSFTEFKLEGTDAGNYQLTQPTGVTGKILPTTNYLDLAGYADFDDYTEVWVDGVAYPIQTEDNRRYAVLPEEGDLLTIFTYKSDSANLSHENYPTGMAVYTIDRQNTGSALERITEFDDLLQYSGCSIRVTGKRGIRMITALTKDNKKALKGAGLAGYTLAEYGTVVQWADTLGNNSLTLGTGKHNYAYKKGVSDPVFANVGDLTQYTNVLVWESLTDEQLGKDIVMRPYIILKDADDNTVTLYGGCVSRSIGYIAYQNRDTFKPGTAAYEYVWGIIKAVYKNDPDIMNQYQGKGGN